MNTTNRYLDRCKATLKVTSDYALAKALDIGIQQLSNYRAERNGADVVTCVKIAEVLKLDPLKVIASIQEETARSPKARDFWKKYSSAAAVLLAVLCTSGNCQQLQVSTVTNVHNAHFSSRLYIM